MLDPAAANFLAKGIEAARSGNRLLAKLHFERATRVDPVDPLVWLWMAWTEDSPAQALVHLKKIQSGPYLEAATAGMQWLALLSGPPQTLATPTSRENLGDSTSSGTEESASKTENGPVYSLGCPNCRGRLRIWGKLIGPLHRCPACRAVFVADQDPNDPKRFTRRLLSTESLSPTDSGTSAVDDSEQPLILVLDNRATRRQLMLNVLRRASYRVQPAVNRDEVLTLANQQQAHLILLDGNMPGLNGLEICKSLRSNLATQHIPIVMLSNRSGFFDQVQAKLAGCTTFVPKPCEADVLLSQISQLLRDPSTSNIESGRVVPELQRVTTVETKAGLIPNQAASYAMNSSNSAETDSIVESRKRVDTLDEDAGELQESIFG